MSLPYGSPFPVSPIIRGLRWALLFAGIIYARGKQKIYNHMEDNYREEECKRKIIRDKQNAIMKARIAAEERENVRLLESGKLFEEPGAGTSSSKKGEVKISKLPDGTACREN